MSIEPVPVGTEEQAANVIAATIGVSKRATLIFLWFFLAMSSYMIPCKIGTILIVQVIVNK